MRHRTIVNIHAPHQQKPQKEREEFWKRAKERNRKTERKKPGLLETSMPDLTGLRQGGREEKTAKT
eukprot:6798863-Prorocentrum_lima.AAC.1